MNIQQQLESQIILVKQYQAELRAAKTVGVRNLLDHGIGATSQDSIMLIMQKIAMIGGGDDYLPRIHEVIEFRGLARRVPLREPKGDKSYQRLEIRSSLALSASITAQEFEKNILYTPPEEIRPATVTEAKFYFTSTVARVLRKEPRAERSLVRLELVDTITFTDATQAQRFNPTSDLPDIALPQSDAGISATLTINETLSGIFLTCKFKPDNSLRRLTLVESFDLTDRAVSREQLELECSQDPLTCEQLYKNSAMCMVHGRDCPFIADHSECTANSNTCVHHRELLCYLYGIDCPYYSPGGGGGEVG